jgi:hypothetical protein
MNKYPLGPKCGTTMETHPMEKALAELYASDYTIKSANLPTLTINKDTGEIKQEILIILMLKPDAAAVLRYEIESGGRQPHRRSDN